jgi:hypothetical protein
MQLPSWALVMMWISGVVGIFMLSKEMYRRFGKDI